VFAKKDFDKIYNKNLLLKNTEQIFIAEL